MSTWPVLEALPQNQCGWLTRDAAVRQIDSPSAWQSSFATMPLPFSQQVNWAEHTIIVLTLGSRPTPGYAAELSAHGLVRRLDTLELNFVERTPAAGAMLPQVMTQPCVLILSKRGDWRRIVARDQKTGLEIPEIPVPKAGSRS